MVTYFEVFVTKSVIHRFDKVSQLMNGIYQTSRLIFTNQSSDLPEQDLIRVHIRFGITCRPEAPLIFSVYNSAWQIEKKNLTFFFFQFPPQTKQI